MSGFEIIHGFYTFFRVSFGGFVFGLAFGLMTAFLTKFTHSVRGTRLNAPVVCWKLSLIFMSGFSGGTAFHADVCLRFVHLCRNVSLFRDHQPDLLWSRTKRIRPAQYFQKIAHNHHVHDQNVEFHFRSDHLSVSRSDYDARRSRVEFILHFFHNSLLHHLSIRG